MDFMHNQLADRRSIRLINVIDDYSCEGLGIDVDFSLASEHVIRSRRCGYDGILPDAAGIA
jgi:putative transposase